MCSKFSVILSLLNRKITAWYLSRQNPLLQGHNQAIFHSLTFRNYKFIRNWNSQSIFVSREVSLLHWLQSCPSLSLFSSAVLLKQVAPDGAGKVLCIRLCWHLLEWGIIKKKEAFQTHADQKQTHSRAKDHLFTIGCGSWLLSEGEQRWVMLQDHRQKQLQFF